MYFCNMPAINSIPDGLSDHPIHHYPVHFLRSKGHHHHLGVTSATTQIDEEGNAIDTVTGKKIETKTMGKAMQALMKKDPHLADIMIREGATRKK